MDKRFHAAVRSREERDQLVLQWQWLPRWVIGQHSRSDTIRVLGVDDAESIGFLALIRAAELWQPGQGVLFKTYATTSIWNRMRRECQERGYMVHMPTYRWKHGDRPMCRFEGKAGCDYPAEPEARPERACDRAEALADALRFLPTQEKEVVRLLYWEGLANKEIAERMKLSKQRINQIKENALKHLYVRMRKKQQAG